MKFHRLVYFYIVFLLSSCSYTDVAYNNELNMGQVVSKPIYLTFRTSGSEKIYLLLERDFLDNKYKLKVRWLSPGYNSLANGENTILKLIINKDKILTLKPLQMPRIVSYHIDPLVIEEEITYLISREILREIAESKTVRISLEGKYESRIGDFNKWGTYRAFKEFLKKS